MSTPPEYTDHEANEVRLIANEIMRRLYTGGHREQLNLLLRYAEQAIEEIDKAERTKGAKP